MLVDSFGVGEVVGVGDGCKVVGAEVEVGVNDSNTLLVFASHP